MVVNQAFGMIGPVLGSFPTERSIVVRERMAKTYRLSAYYLAKLTSELPVVCALPVIFGAIAYRALRLQSDLTKFGTFLVSASAIYRFTCLEEFSMIETGLELA